MKEKGIRCTRTCRVEHTDVICDETKLREVFLNILSNSWITVTLPHRIAEAEHVTHHTQATAGHETELFKGKRLLLAEDNELNAEIAITVLEEAGFEVELAEDGIICVDMLEKADAGYYDLILMDIQMPNMDGYKATRTIRKLADQRKAGIPIVAMTANAFEEDKQDAYNAGMNWHIAKPIRVGELMAALAEILMEQNREQLRKEAELPNPNQ